MAQLQEAHTRLSPDQIDRARREKDLTVESLAVSQGSGSSVIDPPEDKAEVYHHRRRDIPGGW